MGATLEAGEKISQPTNEAIAPQIQQTTTNLHPYRTSTQHFPAMRQRSSVNQTEILNSTTAPSDEEANNPDSTQQEGNEKINLSKLSEGQLPAQGLETYLQEQEKQLIITALKKTGWNKTQAAELLGTTFRSLRYRMKKLEISEDESEL